MTDLHPHISSQESSKGMIISVIVHLLLLLLILTPYFKTSIKQEPIAGIIVSFGNLADSNMEVGGDGLEAAIEQIDGSDETIEDNTPTENSSTSSSVDQETKSTVETKKQDKAAIDPTVQGNDQVSQDTNEATTAADKAAKQKAEEAELQRQREEALAKKKAQFGDLLVGGTGTANSQTGILEGDPDSDVLDELTAGSGSLGGGLVNRGLVYEPTIEESSQQTGRVVIDICVDSEGTVTEARFTQKGSTTTASTLVAAAKRAALKYKFTPSEVDRQCGSLKIEFRVQ